MPNPRPPRSFHHTPILLPVTDEHKEWVSNMLHQTGRSILAVNVVGLILGTIVGTAFVVSDGLIAGVLVGVLVGCFALLLVNVLSIRLWIAWLREKKYLKELKEMSEPPPAEVIPFRPPLRVVYHEGDDENEEE